MSSLTSLKCVSAAINIPLFTGTIWYVDASVGSSGNGLSPGAAFKTIGEAIAAASEGDAIRIGAGTYTETGLDVNVNSIDVWCEYGAIIAPPSGTALTISGDSCLVDGKLKVTPAAGQVGVLVSGDECVLEDVKVMNAGTGIRITGTGTILEGCAVGFPTSVGYDIQGDQTRLYHCSTVGNGATYGYKVSNGADTGVLDSCTSIGHQSAGYYIDTGSQEWTILRCSSGAGDGRWVDVDNVNVWSSFTFDCEVFHTTMFDGSGPGTDNLFKVEGSVEVKYIFGDVTTALSADVGKVYLDLWDGTNSAEITDSAGTDVSSAPVGSLIIKTEKASSPIDLLQSDQCHVEENTSFREPRVPSVLTQKAGATTYIRLAYAGTATSGAIHWHCRWEPLTEDGFVSAA